MEGGREGGREGGKGRGKVTKAGTVHLHHILTAQRVFS